MAPESRRPSFLTVGGANSLSNFALSHQRAAIYQELALVDVSPCTSASDSAVGHLEDGPVPPEAAAGPADAGLGPDGRHLLDFAFPPVFEPPGPGGPEHLALAETSLLLRKHRTSSVFSLVPHAGSSTAPQTVLNAVNTLMGVSMLSLSFGLRLSGWVAGSAFFLGSAYITTLTAKILGSILSRHRYCNSYGDIAHLAGGARFKALVTTTFTVDLLGALLTLILLFSDATLILFPGHRPAYLKLFIMMVTFFLSFLPLSVVSLVSLLGIVCTVGIITVISLCGLTTASLPGSLLHPAATHLWPSSTKGLLFSVGIFMSPWGGHPVFPELYRDMRHPAKYASSCNWAFAFTTLLDLFVGAVGILMYGDHVSDSLTKNILQNTSSAWVKPAACVFISLLSVCKLALIVRPLLYVIEEVLAPASAVNGRPRPAMPQRSSVVRACARVMLMSLLLILSLAFTQFGQVVAFLGSAICCTICVTFPLVFHLKLNAHTLTPLSRLLTRAGVLLGLLAAVVGTYGAVALDSA